MPSIQGTCSITKKPEAAWMTGQRGMPTAWETVNDWVTGRETGDDEQETGSDATVQVSQSMSESLQGKKGDYRVTWGKRVNDRVYPGKKMAELFQGKKKQNSKISSKHWEYIEDGMTGCPWIGALWMTENWWWPGDRKWFLQSRDDNP